jgi:hypothetical protein
MKPQVKNHAMSFEAVQPGDKVFGDISEPWLSYVGAVCLADWGPYAQFAEPGFSAAP